jgi:hypothetical protein
MRRCEDNSKMVTQEVIWDSVDCSRLSQDMDK